MIWFHVGGVDGGLMISVEYCKLIQMNALSFFEYHGEWEVCCVTAGR